MEPEGGAADSRLIERLLQEAPQYSFFQVVQLLERAHPNAARVGRNGPAAREILRFRPPLSLSFPTADVSSIEIVEEGGGRRYVVEAGFLGLYGTVSPLPSWITEDLLHETSEGSLVRGFLDLFHHRIISLFYRCWEKYRYYLQFEPGGEDLSSNRMFSLFGLGHDAAKTRDVPRTRLLRYAGLIGRQSCSAVALAAAVTDYFDGLPAEIVPFAPRWVPVPEDHRARLGTRNARLGLDSQAGAEVSDLSGRFRVALGPLSLPRFVAFLPGESSSRSLDELICVFLRDRLQYEVELRLLREDVPALRLDPEGVGTRLGQTSWLGQPESDPRVVFLEPRRGPLAAQPPA